jgi:phosphoribosyl-dephospho-CoA transferase
MMLQRHDLLRAEPCAWDDMLRCHPGLADLPLVADWARLDRPVIVRRRMAGDCADGVPVALPLPPNCGKRRLAFSFASGAAVVALPAVLLRDAATSAPSAWHPIVAALLELGEATGISPRVFGALLWQHATGLPYLTARSDLDLLWSVSDERTAATLVEGLLRLDVDGPVRVDGELELPDGAAVNWRELAQRGADQGDEVLVKTMDGVAVRTRATLFRKPVSPS